MEWLQAIIVCVVVVSPLAGAIGFVAVVALSLLDNSTPEEEDTTKIK